MTQNLSKRVVTASSPRGHSSTALEPQTRSSSPRSRQKKEDKRPPKPPTHTMNSLALRAAARLAAGAPRRALFSSTAAGAQKVCVIGASGGIGQPMSMLLKQVRAAVSIIAIVFLLSYSYDHQAAVTSHVYLYDGSHTHTQTPTIMSDHRLLHRPPSLPWSLF